MIERPGDRRDAAARGGEGDSEEQAVGELLHIPHCPLGGPRTRLLRRAALQGLAIVLLRFRCVSYLLLRGVHEADGERRDEQRNCNAVGEHREQPAEPHEAAQQRAGVHNAYAEQQAKRHAARQVHLLQRDVHKEHPDDEQGHPTPIGLGGDLRAGDLEEGHEHQREQSRHVDGDDLEDPETRTDRGDAQHLVGLGVLLEGPHRREDHQAQHAQREAEELLGLPEAPTTRAVGLLIEHHRHRGGMLQLLVVRGQGARALQLQVAASALERGASPLQR
mmetsp:Transcript_81389/g.248658  ORF Transcript_81389/g.248658 Transcript_81389/m.248658 type:complete len:277 (-) Transcript_81389:160-990(-)